MIDYYESLASRRKLRTRFFRVTTERLVINWTLILINHGPTIISWIWHGPSPGYYIYYFFTYKPGKSEFFFFPPSLIYFFFFSFRHSSNRPGHIFSGNVTRTVREYREYPTLHGFTTRPDWIAGEKSIGIQLQCWTYA